MPHYVGKHSSRITGADSPQMLRRKVTEKEAEAEPPGGGRLAEADVKISEQGRSSLLLLCTVKIQPYEANFVSEDSTNIPASYNSSALMEKP